jgi:hypothetical protein
MELPPDLTHDEVIAKIASPGRPPAHLDFILRHDIGKQRKAVV